MRQNISIERFTLPIHKTWDKTWFLLTSGNFQKGHFNCMTISWGGLGIMWNFPIAMVVVRPSRYTYEFINQYDEFTICAFPEQYRTALTLLGTKSGRDCDKLSESGLTAEAALKVAAPVYKEADLVIECRKLYWQDFKPEQFLNDDIHKHYASGDVHRMFYGEVLGVCADPDKYPNL